MITSDQDDRRIVFKIFDFGILLGRQILASILVGSLIYSQIRCIALRVWKLGMVFSVPSII